MARKDAGGVALEKRRRQKNAAGRCSRLVPGSVAAFSSDEDFQLGLVKGPATTATSRRGRDVGHEEHATGDPLVTITLLEHDEETGTYVPGREYVANGMSLIETDVPHTPVPTKPALRRHLPKV